MDTKIIFKDAFAVIGKMAQGSANDPEKWIRPLWDESNSKFSEISGYICRNEDNSITGVWGAMNDVNEQNKRWDSEGKYIAGCEAEIDTEPPNGWNKWIIPAQTYLTVECTLDTYGEVFGEIGNDENINITGTVHERYPQPENPNIVELYFPIAKGMIFCQSCAMPMTKTEDFGTESDKRKSLDYCCHCYEEGEFPENSTMEEMIEFCLPYCIDRYENAEAAREDMLNYFPKLKRWAK